MGLDDIEHAMSRRITRLKYDEAQAGGAAGARIVDFDRGRDDADAQGA